MTCFYHLLTRLLLSLSLSLSLSVSVNLQKSDSLFNFGMQPLVYSESKTRASLARGAHAPYQSHVPPPLAPTAAAASMFNTPSANGPIGWYRAGYDIAYYRSNAVASRSKTYTLSFSIQLEYDNDTVYFAFSYPYSVSTLYRTLDSYDHDSRYASILRQRVLCRTLGGNDVPLLMITDFTSPQSEIDRRPAVVITARVHPGESNASWIMKGVIEFLLAVPPSASATRLSRPSSPSGTLTADMSHHVASAIALRRSFFFYLVPCLNPDGVISGNYRCSLAGVDLNRNWAAPERHVHPTIFKTKQLLSRIMGRDHHVTTNGGEPMPTRLSHTDEKNDLSPPSSSLPSNHPPPRDVAVFCDLHGHSRAQNVFIYGVECDGREGNSTSNPPCSPVSSPSPFASSAYPLSSASASTSASVSSPSSVGVMSGSSRAHRLAERVLPKLLALRSPFFNHAACHFQVRKSKETTARVVIAKEMGIVNSFTLEASFGGVCLDPPSNGSHSTPSQSLSSLATPSALSSSRYLGFQFNTRMYEEMGWNLCQSLLDWTNPVLYSAIRHELESALPLVATNTTGSSATSNLDGGVGAGGEDSDDDAEVGGDGEVIRTKVQRRTKRKKKNGHKKDAATATTTKHHRRPRSKSTDERRAHTNGVASLHSQSQVPLSSPSPSPSPSPTLASSSSLFASHTGRISSKTSHTSRVIGTVTAGTVAGAGTTVGGGSDVSSVNDGSDVDESDDHDDSKSSHPHASKSVRIARSSILTHTSDEWAPSSSSYNSNSSMTRDRSRIRERTRYHSAVSLPLKASPSPDDDTAYSSVKMKKKTKRKKKKTPLG